MVNSLDSISSRRFVEFFNGVVDNIFELPYPPGPPGNVSPPSTTEIRKTKLNINTFIYLFI